MLSRNRSWPVIEGDIHGFSSEAILGAAGIKPGDADILIAGPPCQPFSKSGYWARGDALRLDDPRADTLAAFLRVLRDARPRAFLLENVYGLAYKDKDEGLALPASKVLSGSTEKSVLATMSPLRWLNAAQFGVPQLR